jgi:hypothetical protein
MLQRLFEKFGFFKTKANAIGPWPGDIYGINTYKACGGVVDSVPILAFRNK